MTTVSILGASGYVGGELLRLLAAHPSFDVGPCFANSNAGQPMANLHPHLSLAYPGKSFAPFDISLLQGSDLIFAALPHGETQRLADALTGSGARIVDLGADFRLNSAEDFEAWYGEPHQRPDLLGQFIYGLPELHRDRIRNARWVASPGCYPTAASLALKPLIDAGVVESTGVIVDAASGVSGAGRAASAGTHYCGVEGSFRAYGLTRHRHTAEMEMNTGAEVLFTPHLMATSRGILATCYARATGKHDPLAILRDAYADEAFVHVGEALPETKWATGSNAAFLSARFDKRTGTVVALAAIDNLGKGAAGQMIQCANLMFGLDETAGLSRVGVYP
ncbi:N-acetyl-gamma-glutamyl-phosphate reductase [Sphingomonas rhizophila]|uniref:N-acetyl-gamma-glutamyl-phosphate reductase n=1 Tax=Sphingomonas rhizophila TaxID=2071607 RepID=A0A7G9SAY4_9SPHN|nr:N-acetyl-gamma-glutamyl-phosphate reductase [Sphingomonas rhizophila]QNN65009.1 N-acetyl-gamma-glutamyl-phosphate reductase [Sphingomonas rhizophila]